jgi:hypothetical protein
MPRLQNYLKAGMVQQTLQIQKINLPLLELNVRRRNPPKLHRLAQPLTRPLFTVPPVRGFTPAQYNSDGLLAYLEYLRVVLQDDSFGDMYAILSQHRMGIDIFKSSLATAEGMKGLKDELKQDCGIAIGMARCLVENFQSWHKTLGA